MGSSLSTHSFSHYKCRNTLILLMAIFSMNYIAKSYQIGDMVVQKLSCLGCGWSLNCLWRGKFGKTNSSGKIRSGIFTNEEKQGRAWAGTWMWHSPLASRGPSLTTVTSGSAIAPGRKKVIFFRQWFHWFHWENLHYSYRYSVTSGHLKI